MFPLSRLVRAHLSIVGTIVLLYLLDYSRVLAPMERAEFDVLVRTREPRIVTDLTVVFIDGQDYQKWFRGRSPLKPVILRRLIEAVLKGRPSVVGVDIDTSHPMFRDKMNSLRNTTPIVWARGIKGPCAPFLPVVSPAGLFPLKVELPDLSCVVPADVLGVPVPPSPRGFHFAISAFPVDEDGEVRRSVAAFNTEFGPYWSFAQTLRQLHATGEIESPGASHAAHYMDFLGGAVTVPAVSMRYVLAHSNDADWALSAPFRDRIAIVGGSYGDARDVFITPLGPMFGTQIVAQAAQQPISTSPIEPTHLLSVGLEYVCGLVAFCLLHVLPRRGLYWILAFGALPLLSVVGSVLVFSVFGYWLRFAVVILGVYLDQLWPSRGEH